VGCIDSVASGVVGGWLADRTTPDPLAVELLIDGIEAGRILADEERDDLAEGNFGVRHGFCLPVPPQFLDGCVHAIAVRVVGTEPLLTPTPAEQVLGRLTPGPRRAADLPAPRLHRPVELSVIMPTFNRGAVMEMTAGRFLRLADRMNAELIVIDDGSVDDTQDRLNRLSCGARRLVTERVTNGGPASARNLAGSLSRGDVLVFVGDDTEPADDDFLAYHATAHKRLPSIGQAVLGNISWPDVGQLPVNYVMSHIQGVGQQQFGYHYMKAYETYDWRLFYSSNVSIKKGLVQDWHRDGFDTSFHLAALEDQEFALRATLRLEKKGDNFAVLYVPAARLVRPRNTEKRTQLR
jgi:Glycosyl transferase family 2